MRSPAHKTARQAMQTGHSGRKQDIDASKQDIEGRKQDIHTIKARSKRLGLW
jgi:hypothetical protein